MQLKLSKMKIDLITRLIQNLIQISMICVLQNYSFQYLSKCIILEIKKREFQFSYCLILFGSDLCCNYIDIIGWKFFCVKFVP